jgi:hypothetical protein
MTPTPSWRALVTLIAVGATFLLAAVADVGGARGDVPCNPPKYPGNGYFTSLSVSHTTCATGVRVVIAWYHCRIKHGVAGKCDRRVVGYACHEKRVTIRTEFDARVTCRRGDATVVHTYQQNT